MPRGQRGEAAFSGGQAGSKEEQRVLQLCLTLQAILTCSLSQEESSDQ